MKKILVISFLILTSLLIGKTESRFTNSKNVKVISRGKDKELQKEKIWEIEETDDFEGFSYVSKIVLYKDEIYILDSEQWIEVFTKDGEFINQFGTKGKGPGEVLLIKDFAIYNDFIYALDKQKLSISKFDLEYNFIWEKKLPLEFIQSLSPEQIAVNDNGIILSGFSAFGNKIGEINLILIIDEEMKVLNKVMNFDSSKGNDVWEVFCKTATRITTDNENVYLGMMNGKDYLYKIDKNLNVEYVIEKIIPNGDKFEIVSRENGGVELMSYFNTLNIQNSENYIVCGENGGAFTKENDKIKVPKSYKNNVAIYKKSGEYLGSLFNPDFEYSYSTFTIEIEEKENDLFVYMYNAEEAILMKYKVMI